MRFDNPARDRETETVPLMVMVDVLNRKLIEDRLLNLGRNTLAFIADMDPNHAWLRFDVQRDGSSAAANLTALWSSASIAISSSLGSAGTEMPLVCRRGKNTCFLAASSPSFASHSESRALR